MKATSAAQAAAIGHLGLPVPENRWSRARGALQAAE
jgi:hypothetical protein